MRRARQGRADEQIKARLMRNAIQGRFALQGRADAQ
jgi:hypothetical protein